MKRRTDSKRDLSAKRSPADLARQTILKNLRKVWQTLQLAAQFSPNCAENIHDLRVATRRTVAALRSFRRFVPKRDARRLRRDLRSLRRAAGEARDLDVLIQQLFEQKQNLSDTALPFVLRQAISRRFAAQAPLERMLRRLHKRRFPDRGQRLVKRIGWRGEGPIPAMHEYAASEIRNAAANLRQAISLRPLPETQLHALRIQAKWLRYTAELFASTIGTEAVTSAIQMTKELQTRLGVVTDNLATVRRVVPWASECPDQKTRAGFRRYLQLLRQASRRSVKDFRTWWTPQRVQKLATQLARLEN
jgi:CHAD domain-containing protein